MKVLITGVAGFIGMHVAKQMLQLNTDFTGIDNLNDYYDLNLKMSRLDYLKKKSDNFKFKKLDIQDYSKLENLFETNNFDHVIHLAAQAGVRYSIKNPHAYIDSNISGFLNILEVCKKFKVKHLIFASSSSVYGLNDNVPFSEVDNTDRPVSLYACTKKSNELMAHSYSNMFNLPITGLRFFTVYGPWGRPDMSPHIFANAIQKNMQIRLFNKGNMTRDYTYIEDVVDGIINILVKPPIKKSTGTLNIKKAPFNIFNIGNNSPINIKDFLILMEKSMGKSCSIKYEPMQLGDVENTYSDNKNLYKWIGFKTKTPVSLGVEHFCSWYKNFYK